MQYIHAALLLHKAGKEISEENMKKVLQAADISVDEGKVKGLIASLKGVNIDEALKTQITPAAPTQPVAEKAEEKKEEKREPAAEGLAALFG